MTNRAGRLVRKYGNKYNIFKCKFSENRGVSGPNIDKNACGDFFLKIHAFESFFPKVYFKSGPRVHRPPRFWATDRQKFAWHFACRKYAFWRSCLPRKESHTALILYFDWLMFYAKNEAADIFFNETKYWSHFTLSCCFIAGIPTTLFLIWGKPSCFLYETVSCFLCRLKCMSLNFFSNIPSL